MKERLTYDKKYKQGITSTMAPPKIFLTGGTGYIGGSVLNIIATKHPEYSLTVLLRNPPSTFSSLYPNVKVLRGDYDSGGILHKAASEADIVVHCGDSDHEPSIKALLSGLLSQQQSSAGPFLIHLSGTGLVSDWDAPKFHGHKNPKIWSDVQDIAAITSLPDGAPHRNVDKLILAAAAKGLKTAIVCPPDIYGKGSGPGKTRSIFLPMFVNAIRDVGAPFFAEEGENVKSWVHVEDLMKVYLGLVEAAVAGGKGADWGAEGYYFASSQEHSHLEIAKEVGRLLKQHDLCPTPEPKRLSLETVDRLVEYPGFEHVGTYLFAANSRSRADRAGKRFQYKPSARGLMECLEEDLLACGT